METPWYLVSNIDEVESPGLLVYRERVHQNTARMIAMAGGTSRLRPHVKTHKMAAVLQLQLQAGLTKFKVATLAEAEMAATVGAPDLLLAYQPVGPNRTRLAEVVRRFPQTRFSTIIDDSGALHALSKTFTAAGLEVGVFLDLDCGMRRSGIAPGPVAVDLYRQICSSPGLYPAGIHSYDGHLHQTDRSERKEACEKAFALVAQFRDIILTQKLPVPSLIMGGTPTFPFHAQRPDVECGPGTCVFWDFGYATKLPDMDFVPAAAVVTRVVSKPGSGRLCLDLGHKAIAAENPPPRVHFPELPDAQAVGHSEEHLVVETKASDQWKVGDVLYGIPWHICPTVALHAQATVIESGRAVTKWPVTARNR